MEKKARQNTHTTWFQILYLEIEQDEERKKVKNKNNSNQKNNFPAIIICDFLTDNATI